MDAQALKRRKKGILYLIVFVGAVGTVLGILAFKDPVTTGWMPQCPVYSTTGTYCPGCGSTRALHAMVHGKLWKAFDHNPLLMIFLPFLTYSMVSKARVMIFGKELPMPNLKPWALWSIFGIIIVYWIVRNFPWEPFTFLAP